MRIETTDPITLVTIRDLTGHPFVIEGEGENALKIFFENEASRKEYLEISVEHPGEDFKFNLDNPAPMGGDRRQ